MKDFELREGKKEGEEGQRRWGQAEKLRRRTPDMVWQGTQSARASLWRSGLRMFKNKDA